MRIGSHKLRNCKRAASKFLNFSDHSYIYPWTPVVRPFRQQSVLPRVAFPDKLPRAQDPPPRPTAILPAPHLSGPPGCLVCLARGTSGPWAPPAGGRRGRVGTKFPAGGGGGATTTRHGTPGEAHGPFLHRPRRAREPRRARVGVRDFVKALVLQRSHMLLGHL